MWLNLQGTSIFDYMSPVGQNGIYGIYDSYDKPESTSPFYTIVKMTEAMLAITNASHIYLAFSRSSQWERKWIDITSPLKNHIGNKPLTLVIENNEPDTTKSYTLTKDMVVQFNLSTKGEGSGAHAYVNNICVFGMEHISGNTFYSCRCRAGDVIKVQTIGLGTGNAYIQ